MVSLFQQYTNMVVILSQNVANKTNKEAPYHKRDV